MTVEQWIEELQKIDDKTKDITININNEEYQYCYVIRDRIDDVVFCMKK